MKHFRFKKIDAFASDTSPGNPAGCVLLSPGQEISGPDMQRIARELKGVVSEVGYVREGIPGMYDFQLQYYSCEKEVDFCGHATIAIMDDLVGNDDRCRNKKTLTIQTNKGLVLVWNRVDDDGRVYIRAPDPVFIDAKPDTSELSAALNLDAGDLDVSIPPGIVNAGLNTLLVPLTTLDACIRCSPDYRTLRNYSLSHATDVVTVFTWETAYPDHDLHTRVFAPAFGYLEDPATGSGNAALGNFLIRNKLWDTRSLVIEQGPDRVNPNIVTLLRPDDGSLMFGGNGRVRIDGQYILS